MRQIVAIAVVFLAVACSGSNGAPGATGSKGDPGIVWQGTWSAGTTYTDGDAVQFNGSAWVSIQDANQGNSPDSSPTFWQLLAMKGDTGDTGTMGAQGAAGLACWDLNGNSACDTGTEDFTGDSMCTVADCQGSSRHFQWKDATETLLDVQSDLLADTDGYSYAAQFTDGNGHTWGVSLHSGAVVPRASNDYRYWESNDCSGTPYLRVDNGLPTRTRWYPGNVLRAWPESGLGSFQDLAIVQDVEYRYVFTYSGRNGDDSNPCGAGIGAMIGISYSDLEPTTKPPDFTTPITATPVP